MARVHEQSVVFALLLLASGACDNADPRSDTSSPDVVDSDGSTDADDGVDAPDATEPFDSSDASPHDGSDSEVIAPGDGFLTLLAEPADLAALSSGDEVKFLAPLAGKTPPAPLTADCYFQDMNRWQWHIDFLHSFAELADLPYDAYVSLALKRATRTLWAGSVEPFGATLHPRTNKPGVVAYSVYSESTVGSLTVDDLIEVDARLEECIPFAQDLLVFVPQNTAQNQLVFSQRPALEAGDVDIVLPQALRPDLIAEAYVEGEGYGTLLVVPEGEHVGDYGPRDIVIAQSAPNDIALVAGLVTKDPQNVHSHVNLRLAEKQIPSASVTAIYDSALVATYAGKLVHLVVDGSGVLIEPATLAAAEAFWRSRQPDVPDPVADLTVTTLSAFDTLRASDALAYGVKAANLGELFHILDAEHRVPGFGIPFARYVAFMEATGLDHQVEGMMIDERMKTDAAYAATRLEALREEIEDAPFPAELMEALTLQLRATFGDAVDTTRIRFRSSTNAEDLDVISGAGLYDSKSGCLADDLDGDELGPSRCLGDEERAFLEGEVAARKAELLAHPERVWLEAIIEDFEGDLVKEKPVARAVRKVWASLWNERAYEEREYYGIDHTKVFMGIAVDPSFVLERANAVAVTNLPSAAGGPIYRVVSQTGWLSVVRPEDPLAVAEVLTFHRAPGSATPSDVQVLVPSTLVPEGETVWSESELATLATLLYQVQDHFAAEVYPDIEPLALDLEIKRTSDHRIVLKQVRPYLGVGE